MFQQGTTSPCSNKEQTSSSPATNNAIRGAEQSGNIAKQRFARTRWVRGLTWQSGRHDIASGRYRNLDDAFPPTQVQGMVLAIWICCTNYTVGGSLTVFLSKKNIGIAKE